MRTLRLDLTVVVCLFAPLAAACGSSDTNVNPITVDSGAADSSAGDTGSVSVVDSGTTDSGSAGDTATTNDTGVVTDSGAGETAADGSTDAGTACLASPGTDAYFTIADTSKCVVARYTSGDIASPGSLTWGRHEGPLGFDGTNVLRYSLPSGATGALTSAKTKITVTGVPSGAFFGTQALDVPFFPTLKWTAIAYTGSGTGFPGEVIFVDDTGATAKRYDVNGFFAETAVGVAVSGGRLLYTGLSPLSDTTSTTNAGGVYAADACGTEASNPRLLPEGDSSCKASIQVSTWEAGNSGPITADGAGNVFAILSTFGGNQELRGFAASTVARGQGAVAGTKLFAESGTFTSEMTADGHAIYFQPIDGSTFTAKDPVEVAYTVTGATIAGAGSTTPFLTMKTAGTSVALFTDHAGRVWVGVSDPATGDAGATSSTFFVLAAK